ncbi:MAG: gamma-glutamyltransferase family protein [Candidatus Limnocylindrales bacterium]
MSIEPTPATVPARPARGRHGAVASPHHLATQAGLHVLRSGGSAVDAAIATNAALAVVAGHSCGLGGDAFWLVWDEGQRQAEALNGSGRSGRAATIEAVIEAGHRQMPQRGRWSITVPGAVHSWGEAHRRFGHLAWGQLLEPALELASGFPASPGWLEAIERSAVVFGADGDWASVYRPDERARRPGALVRLPALERTLRALVAEGPSAAYDGSVADRTTAYFAARGVPIGRHDLAAHTSDWSVPLSADYRGLTSLTHAPNSVGVVALQTLRLLSRFGSPDPTAWDGRGWTDAAWIHLGLEASRLALAERDAHVTDPGHMAAGEVEAMLSSRRIDELADRIDAEQARPPRPGTLPAGGGTVYLATADRWGNAVSLLASNYQGFGSGLVDPATGIAFHDRGAFFRLDPTHANALAPRKRPTHTLAPGMLMRDGAPWVVHGSMGGEIQPQVFAQVVSALVDGGSDVATAVAAPRWAAMMRRQHGAPDLTELEARCAPDVPKALARMGHDVEVREAWASSMGHAQAIEIVRDESGAVTSYAAGTDPRAEGSAAAW